MAIGTDAHEVLDETGAFELGQHPSAEAGMVRVCSDHFFVRKNFATARADFLEENFPLGEGHGGRDTHHPELHLSAFPSLCSQKHQKSLALP